jgi:hypothetical protein
MNKKGYEKPTMTVVLMRQRCHILTGSMQGQAGVQDYTITDEYNW